MSDGRGERLAVDQGGKPLFGIDLSGHFLDGAGRDLRDGAAEGGYVAVAVVVGKGLAEGQRIGFGGIGRDADLSEQLLLGGTELDRKSVV